MVKVNPMEGIAVKIKKLAKMPNSLDGLPLKVGVDEKLIFRLHIWGYRIISYKTKRR